MSRGGVTTRGDRADRCRIQACRQLLDEMICNLCDNAIKYNRPAAGSLSPCDRSDRKARSSLWPTRASASLQRTRAGCFERFYRVDKSHSNEPSEAPVLVCPLSSTGRLFHGAQIYLTVRWTVGPPSASAFPNENRAGRGMKRPRERSFSFHRVFIPQ
ncbi:MAG: hypothetical protein ACLUJG_08585 [Lawsonibacter sp.]